MTLYYCNGEWMSIVVMMKCLRTIDVLMRTNTHLYLHSYTMSYGMHSSAYTIMWV